MTNTRSMMQLTLRKSVLPIACVCGLLLSGCDIETKVVKPPSFYDISLSAEIKNKADQYKPIFVENKLEDEEVDGELTEEEQTKLLEKRFEKSINALYVSNVHEESSLHLVLDLVEFSTDLFKEHEFSEQLAKRSSALSDFMIDYQINLALSSKENQVWDQQMEQQGEIMAEQQSEHEILKSRYASLKRTEERLRDKLAEAESKLANMPEPIAEDVTGSIEQPASEANL